MANIFDVVKTTTGKDLFNGFENGVGLPKQIWGNFIHENELCILFGDSNAGKSILANDIAFFVSGGKDWGWGHESPNIPSLYIDMEMTRAQFASRYIGGKDLVPDNYSRAEVNVYACDEDKIYNAIKVNIVASQSEDNPPKFIVIDNITNGFGSIHSASKMRELIGNLKSLKDRFGLTILLIAHCPKRRPNTPITADNLGGSKMIINFVDSAFAVACGEYASMRYIKQIKARNNQKGNYVKVAEIVSEPYVHFEYNQDADEELLLENDLVFEMTPQHEARILQMYKEGQKAIDISDTIGLCRFEVMAFLRKNDLL